MKFLLVAITSLFFCSCATYRKGVGAAEDNLMFISPAVSLATSIVFEKGISTDDRAEKALIIKKLALKIAEVEFTAKPTKGEIVTLVSDQLPDKPHWASLSLAVANVYEKYTRNLLDSDVTSALAVIQEIAAGLDASASNYL
jgi:hypothetical protein